MSATCTIAVQSNLMKPLPNLPPPSPMTRGPGNATRSSLPLTYLPMSTDHTSPYTIIPGPTTDKVLQLSTVQERTASEALACYPFEPDCIILDPSDLLPPASPPPNATEPKQPQPPPPKSTISHSRRSNTITYPRVPQRSATDSYILTSHNARHFLGTRSNHGHQFDQLPTISTRLDAWIQENQHHAEPSADEDAHELRCDKCRFGVGLIDVQNPNVTGKSGWRWNSPKQRQMQRSARSRMRSCTMPAGRPTGTGTGTLITVKEVDESGSESESGSGSGTESETGSDGDEMVECVMLQQIQGQKSVWDKPSFKAFLLRIGALKGQ